METSLTYTHSLGNLVFENRLPILEEIFLSQGLESIANFAQLFPDDLTPFWGYEIPMGHTQIIPDFLFCVDSAWKLYETFLTLPGHTVNPLLELNPLYHRYYDLAGYWLQCQKEGNSSINNVWFEFDLRDILEKTYAPNFFFAPSARKIQALMEDTQLICSIMGAKPILRSTLNNVSKIANALPEKGQISQIGQMLARQDPHLRLFIQSIKKHQLLPFLTTIDYPEARANRFLNLLKACQDMATQVDINLDVYEEIGSSIGLELYFKGIAQVLNCLDFCTEQGLVSPTLFEAFTRHLKTLSKTEGQEFQHFFSHFKIVYHPIDPMKAKAYFAFAKQHLVSKLIYLNLP